MFEEPTEEVNGLQIIIPSSSESYSAYDRRFAEELHAFTAYIPEIKILLASSEGGKELLIHIMHYILNLKKMIPHGGFALIILVFLT